MPDAPAIQVPPGLMMQLNVRSVTLKVKPSARLQREQSQHTSLSGHSPTCYVIGVMYKM